MIVWRVSIYRTTCMYTVQCVYIYNMLWLWDISYYHIYIDLSRWRYISTVYRYLFNCINVQTVNPTSFAVVSPPGGLKFGLDFNAPLCLGGPKSIHGPVEIVHLEIIHNHRTNFNALEFFRTPQTLLLQVLLLRSFKLAIWRGPVERPIFRSNPARCCWSRRWVFWRFLKLCSYKPARRSLGWEGCVHPLNPPNMVRLKWIFNQIYEVTRGFVLTWGIN